MLDVPAPSLVHEPQIADFEGFDGFHTQFDDDGNNDFGMMNLNNLIF